MPRYELRVSHPEWAMMALVQAFANLEGPDTGAVVRRSGAMGVPARSDSA